MQLFSWVAESFTVSRILFKIFTSILALVAQGQCLPSHLFMLTGDSGGPLILMDNRMEILENARDVLLGVVSFSPDFCGLSSASKLKPDVFTDVTKFVGWIHDITAAESVQPQMQDCKECTELCKNQRSVSLCQTACVQVIVEYL